MTPGFPHRWTWRLLALLGCVGILSARVAEPLHFAALAHRVCAEHGEAIELTVTAPDPRAAPARAGWAADPLAAGNADAHSHCLTAQSIRSTAARGPSGAGVPAARVALAAPVLDEAQRAVDPRRLLHDAPKASPPSAG